MLGVIRGLEPIMAVAQRLQLFASLLYGVHKPATEWLFCCIRYQACFILKELTRVDKSGGSDVLLHFTHKLDALEMMGASDVPECCRSLLPHQVDPPRRGKPRGQLEHGPRYGESGPQRARRFVRRRCIKGSFAR